MDLNALEFNEKKLLLLLFTRELIMHSGAGIPQLQEILSQKKPDIKVQEPAPQNPAPKKEEKQVEFPKESMIKSILSSSPQQQNETSAMKPVHINPPRMEIPNEMPRRNLTLRIPEPKLPEQFQYLKPTPANLEIDLGKLNALLNDSAVQTIECDGPDKPIIVSGRMGRKPSNVKLSNQEVEEVIQKISKASKIPADTGVYRVVLGNLIFSAIISEVVPSRFTIKKMQTAGNFVQPIGPKSSNPNFGLYFRR